MRVQKPLTICVGCQDNLTDEKLAEIICNALLDDFLPKELHPGSSVKVTVNLEFSIPDFL